MDSNAPYSHLNLATRGTTSCVAVKGIFTPPPLTKINTNLTLLSSALLGFGWDERVCACGVVEMTTIEVMELGILGGGRDLKQGSGRLSSSPSFDKTFNNLCSPQRVAFRN